jgi:hypothetical protein
MKRLLLILSLVVVAGATSGAVVRSAVPALERTASSADGAIVFASNRDGDADLYAVNTDGTGLTQLTNAPADDYDPLPSRLGVSLAALIVTASTPASAPAGTRALLHIAGGAHRTAGPARTVNGRPEAPSSSTC